MGGSIASGLTELQSDDDIIRAAQRGDQAARALLYNKLYPAVWQYVYARVGNPHDAEDIVSDTWISAIRSIRRFDRQCGCFRAWLVGIAHNKILDFWRRKGREEIPIIELPEPSVAESDPDIESVRKALLGLDPDQRGVLIMMDVDDLRVREIAQILGRTESAIQNMLRRAREAFRAIWMFLEKMTMPEIAKQLKRAVEEIETLICRARRRWRDGDAGSQQ